MKIGTAGSSHLAYCLNVHPGESWPEQFAAIRTHALAVRDRVAAGQPFGLGLRLSAASASQLREGRALAAFRDFLRREQLYVFTVNAFPFGSFHGTRVKESVYRPDWRSEERARYTEEVARILAALMPEDGTGSISTVPVGYGPDFDGVDDRARAADRLIAFALFLAGLERETGRYLHLGLEPEPGCVLESADDTLDYFALLLERAGPAEPEVRRHIGVCLDTCHAALAFEDSAANLRRYADSDLRVSKIQLSAALEVTGAAPPGLSRFAEPVYLHQVRMRCRGGRAAAWPDLPEALDQWPQDADVGRIHFHVPMFWAGTGALRSTASSLSRAFWSRVRDEDGAHVEIETYTFDVLPPELRAGGVVDSISKEYFWALGRVNKEDAL